MFSSADGADIHLDITIGTNGSVDIKHSLSEDYLRQYVPKWQQEVKDRGLAGVVNVEELRQEVMDYFVSEELKQSMWQKFIQYVNATVGTKVGGYVEAIQATQKVTNNIWEEGTLPQDLWYYENSQSGGESWPEYMRMSPETGGGVDGVIDEIVGLPLACKSIYQLATDKEKRDALKAVFTKEGAKQLLQGLKQEAIEIGNDDKKLRHFASQTTVSVAAIFLGTGLLSKAGKSGDLLDVVEQGLKKAEDLPNPSLVKNIDVVKKSERTAIKEVEIKSFAEAAGNDILSDIGEDFIKIYKKGESADVLAKARNLPGVSIGAGKEIKGKWLKGTEDNAGLFPKSVADKLKGKSYANFDEFRKDFWKAVADDLELSKQFKQSDLDLMKDGRPPIPVKEQWRGKQSTYQIHHITPINQGGRVYDMDNLYIVTPRFHKEILDPKYHYGYGY